MLGSWVGVRGLMAKGELDAAIPLAATIRSEVLARDSSSAVTRAKAMVSHTSRARELTSDRVWRATESLPFVGPNLVAVRELAAIADDVTSGAVQPLASLASTLDTAYLKPRDGAIDLEPLVNAGTTVNKANNVISAASDRVNAVETSSTLRQIKTAVEQLGGLLADIAPALTSANELLGIGPDALGASAPRNYLIVFQNNAEARALGGTSLSFAVVTMDKGRITLGSAVPAGLGNFAYYPASVVPMPDGVSTLYGSEFGRAMSNVTVRPSFVGAAEVAREMWKRQFGTTVDGVISVDPVALGYLLRATAPISLSTGDVLTSDNLAALLLNGVYMRYWSEDLNADNSAQDAVYAEIVGKTFDELSSGSADPALLISALTQSVGERRILFWSPKEEEQAAFESLGADGPLPKSDKNADRVGVYLQENVGSKMNYYLQQAVSLGKAVCRADGKASYRIGVDLTNGLPADAATSISPSILGQYMREGTTPGVQRMLVMLYAPPGSQIVGATVDGAPVQLESFHDTDYPVAKLIVSMEPGATSKITLDVVAAATGTKALEAEVTPMVNPTTISDLPLDCATVAAG